MTMPSSNSSRFILAGALGGGITGALLLLVILLLTTCCTIALCWTRKSKTKNQPLQEHVYDEIDKQPTSDREFELKDNEAYVSTTNYIPTEDNVAYGQTTLQISTEDNIAYGQII